MTKFGFASRSAKVKGEESFCFAWDFSLKCKPKYKSHKLDNMCIIPEIKRSIVRQCRGCAKVHRESSADRRIQIWSSSVCVRAVVSPVNDLSVQGGSGSFRHRKIFLGAIGWSLSTSHKFFSEQTRTRLLGKEGTHRCRYFYYIY